MLLTTTIRPAGLLILSLWVLAACGPGASVTGTSTGSSASSTPSTSSTGASGETTASTPTTTSVSTGTSTGPSPGTSTDSSAGTTDTTGAPGCAFEVPPPGPCNGGGTGVTPCDLIAQDCGNDAKCTSYPTGGGLSWAVACVPVVADPNLLGEPCVVKGMPGEDSCAKGTLCWNPEPGTGVGECAALCTCSFDDLQCSGPDTQCVRYGTELAVCLPVCDPLAPSPCGAREVCVPLGGTTRFVCHMDISGPTGALGDDCEYYNDCDPGLFCGPCTSGPCCVSVCDLSAPNCPGSLGCMPWYAPKSAPKCFEDVGFCSDL